MTDEEKGEQKPDHPTRQEFADLATAVGELRDALNEQRQADSPKEREEAAADVREAKADLKTLAKELGLDPKRLEEAAEAARRQQRKDELRPLLVELLDEELADPENEGDGGGKGEDDGKPKDGKADDDPGKEPPKDSEPKVDHWSDRPLSSLFGGGGR